MKITIAKILNNELGDHDILCNPGMISFRDF